MSSILSIREQILQNIATRFNNVVVGGTYTAPDGAIYPYTQRWNAVIRHIPAQTDIKVGGCLAIITGKETMKREVQRDSRYLRVVLEFYADVYATDIVSTEQNRILLEVQATLAADISCGGLAIDIVELQNECSIEGPAEKVMAGMLEIEIRYRHRTGNPRLQ
jgi:hypothetical protein